MKLFFVRHGQTNYNAEKDLVNSDPSKDVHLTELGKSQAKNVAEKLKHKNIDIIFVSELPRTRQTANIINVYHTSPIKVDKRINDRKTGFEGRPYREFVEAVEKDIFNTKFGDGESFLEEKERVFSFLSDLKSLNYDNVLVVSHGEPIKLAVGYFKSLSNEDIWKLNINNCQLLEFEFV